LTEIVNEIKYENNTIKGTYRGNLMYVVFNGKVIGDRNPHFVQL